MAFYCYSKQSMLILSSLALLILSWFDERGVLSYMPDLVSSFINFIQGVGLFFLIISILKVRAAKEPKC